MASSYWGLDIMAELLLVRVNVLSTKMFVATLLACDLHRLGTLDHKTVGELFHNNFS